MIHPRHSTGRFGNPFARLAFLANSALLATLLLASAAFGASNVVEITYDADGNATNLARQVAAGFAITSFDPTSGPVGATVTIYGAGFSATPANNAVGFNGTAATVAAATSGSISTTVPTGATTGRITVTVAASTATSAQDFVVTIPGAPTISGFAPASGASGTSVAVTGAHFDAGPITVKLNGVTATSSVANATSLNFSVPASAASGRVTASNGAGTGTSAADFIVPPAGVNAADIVSSARISVGGASGNVVVGTANKSAIILFDALADTYYSLQFSTFQTSPTNATVAYKVMKPDNTVLVTGSLGYFLRPSIHLPKLAAGGTYSVLLSPGTATMNTNVRVAANPVLTVDGAPLATSLDFAYQSARFTFDAAANQRIGVGALGVSFTPPSSSGPVYLAIYKPDGTLLSSGGCSGPQSGNPQGNCDSEFTAPVTGTYALVAENPQVAFSNLSVQLSSNVTGTLSPDVAQVVTLARVGQDAQYTFTASAGDSFGIDISAAAQQPQAQSISVSISKPDGSNLTSCSGSPPANVYCELGSLVTAGTYTVLIDPGYGAYGSFKLTLKQGALLTTTDPATAFAPAAVPESARMRFSASAGQTLSLGVFDLAYIGSGSSSFLKVYGPDRSSAGTAVCSPSFPGGRCKINLVNLPTTGTYSVVIVPPSGVQVSGSIALSSELTGTLVAGTPQSLNVSRAGQSVRFTFAGTAGDSTSVKLYSVSTTPAAQNLSVTVNKPDGSYLGSSSVGTGSSTLVNLGSLPVTGTYTVLIDSSYGFTWQGQLSLDPGVLISIGGPASTLVTTLAGEPLRFRFTGTAGQRVEFGLAGLAYAPASASGTSFTLNLPNGSGLISMYCYTAGAAACETSVASLPTTGTYSAVFAPPSAISLTGGTFAFSTPLAGSLVVGDPAQTIAITRPGQTARYTFSGTAAQLLRLNWSSTTVASGASVAVTVLKPDGSTLSSSSFLNGATGGLDIASLPTSGNYTVVVDPSLAATMSAAVTLATR